MTKMFCDRCGKEITKEHGWIKHKTLYASIRLFSGRHAEWSEQEGLYICPECEDSYIHWFMNPEGEDCEPVKR